jgi:hypothetical protein
MARALCRGVGTTATRVRDLDAGSGDVLAASA